MYADPTGRRRTNPGDWLKPVTGTLCPTGCPRFSRDGCHRGRRWTSVPRILIDEAKKKLEATGITESLVLEETLVYASYNPATEGRLRNWLDSSR